MLQTKVNFKCFLLVKHTKNLKTIFLPGKFSANQGMTYIKFAKVKSQREDIKVGEEEEGSKQAAGVRVNTVHCTEV